MPMVKITLGTTTKEVKQEIISKVTKTISEVTGIHESKFMTAITELSYDNLGLGTTTVSHLIETENL